MVSCTAFTSAIAVVVTSSAFFTSLAQARDCSSLPQDVTPIILALSSCTSRSHDAVPAANSYGIAITLANQEICVSPSVFTNNTFIPTVQVCQSDNQTTFATCTSRRGGLLDEAASGVNFSSITAANDSPPDSNWGAIDPTNSVTRKGAIDMRLPGDISVPQFSIKTIEGGQSHNEGHFGLSESSPILQYLSDQKGLVNGFALDAGSQSVTNPRDGNLIIGGYDPQRVGAYTKNYTQVTTQRSGRICTLYVTITELVLSRPNMTDLSLLSRGEEIPACIDPYDTLFRFPNGTLTEIAQQTGFVNGTLPDPSKFYVVEPGLTFPTEVGFNGSLTFTLDNDFVVTIPNEELVHPLRGIDSTGAIAVMSNITEVNIFRQSPLLDTAVLGKAFLSKVYLAVEYRSTGAVFRLATNTPGHFNPDPVPFQPDCSVNSGLSPGKIAAIVVPVTVAALAILILIFYIYRRRRINRFVVPGDRFVVPGDSGPGETTDGVSLGAYPSPRASR